jgi:ABC-type ATPase with predicted acetyltransferase domain
MKNSISSCILTKNRLSDSTRRIFAEFGLAQREFRLQIAENLQLTPAAGQIVFLTGPSGSGKTSLLRIFRTIFTPNLDLMDLPISSDRILTDHFDLPLEKALYFLSLTGLADAPLLLLTPHELSDGQLFRFRLALALSHAPPYIFCDNFLDALDRLSAGILAGNLRKFACRSSSIFLLASPHHDIIPQLKPDHLIEKPLYAPAILKSFHRRIAFS